MLKTDYYKIKHTIEECIELAKSKNGECLSIKYVNARTKLEWKCNKGHIWNATFNTIKKCWCPICGTVSMANKQKSGIEECRQFAINKNGRCLAIDYNNSDEKIEWECEYKHTWLASYSNIKHGGYWCPACAKNKKHTIEDCVKAANEKDGYCLSTIYENVHSKIIWKCKNEHIWAASFSSIYSNDTWCPTCIKQISKAQIKIYNELLKLNYDLEIILNDKETIKPFHFDIYIPELKIAIEYDGDYWHYSDWAIKNGSLERMAYKNEICEEFGIHLIRIRESHWNNDEAKELAKIIKIINNNL